MTIFHSEQTLNVLRCALRPIRWYFVNSQPTRLGSGFQHQSLQLSREGVPGHLEVGGREEGGGATWSARRERRAPASCRTSDRKIESRSRVGRDEFKDENSSELKGLGISRGQKMV